MTYQVGQRVITLDNEQGFISQIYDCGSFDVDILDDDGVESVTVGFAPTDRVQVSLNQIPELSDICPLGVITGIQQLRDGIVVVRTAVSDSYAGLWLSDDRVDYLLDAFELGFPYRCWLDYQHEHFEESLTYLDVSRMNGTLGNSHISHYDIAEACELEVMLTDGSIQKWTAAVDGSGRIKSVLTSEGKELSSLGELRDTGIIEATLISRYDVVNF